MHEDIRRHKARQSRAGLASSGGSRGRNRRWGPWWDDWGPEWGGPPSRGSGQRMRRGDIRTALLSALEEGPAHGYELINRLEQKSSGMWRPSPGSVYPTLQLLEDEGLVNSEKQEGKRVYQLTDAGRQAANERSERSGGAPWEQWTGENLHETLKSFRKVGERMGPLFKPLAVAMRQVAMEGDPSKLDRAADVLRKATKDLYQILAQD